MKTTFRILIIDDSIEDRFVYKRLLESQKELDCVFMEAGTGEIGIDLFHKEKPDCLLLDFNLPDMTGLEILTELNLKYDVLELPVVMLTGNGNEQIAVTAMKRGAKDYIPKENVTSESLFLAVDNAISKVAMYHRTKELESVKANFLSTASHELRTPLTIIKEFVSLVNDEIAGPITLEQKDCLSSVLQNCERLSNLINDILDLQRIEGGDPNIHRQRIDLSKIIEHCKHDFLPQCERKNQQLEIEYAELLPFVLCDPEKIIQVLVNLVGNAQKFTPEGGKIKIKASCSNTADEYVHVEVIDSGIGISSNDQEIVWGRFSQVGRQDGPGAKGTGLGLSIVKNLIKMHDGQVQLTSALDKGSTFSFTIPIHTDKKELFALISDHHKVAMSRDNELWVMMVRCNSINQLKVVEQDIRNALYRREDTTTIIKSEKLIIVTAEVDGEGRDTLRQRIENSVADKPGITTADNNIRATDSISEWVASMKEQLKPVATEELLKHVLVIDDEEDILDMVSLTLETSDLNLKVDVASNGYDACLHFGELNPDLVILDFTMPGFDGYLVLQTIKKSERWNNVKVMAISGDREKCNTMIENGADDYLLKPFQIKDLIDKTSRLLGEDGTSNPE